MIVLSHWVLSLLQHFLTVTTMIIETENSTKPPIETYTPSRLAGFLALPRESFIATNDERRESRAAWSSGEDAELRAMFTISIDPSNPKVPSNEESDLLAITPE